MSTMQCNIVSAEREIFSGRVEMIVVTGTLGELGILPGHTPLLTGIRPGPVRLVLPADEERVFFASGGFLEVQPTEATILADTAERAENLDEAAALEARTAAERELRDRKSEFEYAKAAAQLAEAVARLRTLKKLRDRRK